MIAYGDIPLMISLLAKYGQDFSTFKVFKAKTVLAFHSFVNSHLQMLTIFLKILLTQIIYF